ncbi:DNA adenine methylase [Halorubrum ezzemoulense]|uniref:DNA adenine methylase n=1 Tax=Halorubrum ezzemoulense TaxID=337243 RepID=UPI00211B1F84|nr:DNA adenine methylase [Halorubrum ezzemoulense]
MSSRALSYANKVDRLDEFAERFGDVVVENLDWADVFEKYDSEDTVFYCDPPYVGYEDYYLVNTIDHEALVDGLAGLGGDWICSYEDLPEGFEDVYVLDRDGKRFISNGKRGEAKDAKERLVMNFEPEARSQ